VDVILLRQYFGVKWGYNVIVVANTVLGHRGIDLLRVSEVPRHEDLLGVDTSLWGIHEDGVV
jgi:hypothetical protein